MKGTVSALLIIAVLIRLVLAASSYHSDLGPWDLAGRVISQGNVLNFYDYIRLLPKDNPIAQNYPSYLFNYPPAIYFFYGALHNILTLAFPQNFLDDFLFHFTNTLGNPLLNLHLLLLKLPFIFFDIPIAFMIKALVEGEKQKKAVWLLWLFNPINLYATYLIGQFDIIPTFFVISCLYLLQKKFANNLLLASVALGVGIAFKIFPLLLIVPFLSVFSSWRKRLGIIAAVSLPYLLSILPFLSSPGFKNNALVANQSTKSLYAQIPISGGEAIIVFLAAVVFVYFLFLRQSVDKSQLWRRFFIVLLVFFMFTHFHPQWLVWLTPFLILDLVKNNFKDWLPLLVLCLSFFGMILLFDPGLSIWLFSPISPKLYGSPGLIEMLGKQGNLNLYRSVLQTIFFGCGLYYLRITHEYFF